MSQKNLKVAIAGNPNSGKTSIFNELTGSHQHVGNYPGVTVEKKWGSFVHDGIEIDVVDLPGTYSLEVKSLDEKVARDFIINEQPDVIINVIDASNVERSLYLTSQLIEIGVRLVFVLNMSDRARAKGQELNLAMISERLNCETVETVGSRGEGIDKLKDAIISVSHFERREIGLDYGEEIDDAISEITLMSPSVGRWTALKILEKDVDVINTLTKQYGESIEPLLNKANEIVHRMESHHGDSFSVLVADRRYGFAAGLYREVVRKESVDKREFSERVDDILTNRILGIPIFLGFMYLVFYLTFKLGEFPVHGIENLVGWLGGFVEQNWPSSLPLKSLVVNGVIDGVGGVITFLPTIVILFACIAILEDTGYMARAAFIMDRLMHKIGLHGKSFIPMLIGFGCSVPAIMATRTLEHRRDRLATMFVIPLMSCGARLTIYSLIIPAFFPPSLRAKVLWLIYVVGILMAILLVRLLRSTFLRGESAPFVMELPPYRMPTIKGILIHMWERSKLYLRKAGTIILAVSILMWFLTSYPKPTTFEIDQKIATGTVISEADAAAARASETLKYSVAGRIGYAMEPIMKPIGFDWRISTALIGAFVAKEVFISQLAIVFSIGDTGEQEFSLREHLRKSYTTLTGICVMLFCLIATPCVATVSVMRKESGRFLYAVLQFVGLTLLAYVVVLIVYQVGKFIVVIPVPFL